MIFRLAACLLMVSFAWTCAAAVAAESDAGFTEMFNGKDLTGWEVDGTPNNKEGKPIWTVEDSTIRCGGTGFGFLRYNREFKDFIFEVEYRMTPKCNSGLGIRTTKFLGKANTRPSFYSYEIQILDDAGKQPSTGSSGSLYRYVAPKVNASKPAGEWNKIRIECRGPKIRITLNDQVVQDVDQSQIDALKKKPLEGYLCLQNHGKAIDFRNPRVKPLE